MRNQRNAETKHLEKGGKLNMAKIMSIINYKGGVGKTTSTFNIATGISFLTGQKVLLIDLDPQCSLTNICLKAYSRLTGREIRIEDLEIDQTVNYIIRSYLQQQRLGIAPKFDLDRLITRKFYRRCSCDLIPATMFDETDKTYLKGLDDLEIEMSMQQLGPETRLSQVAFFAKFLTDTNLTEDYDWIIFDCPPANNLISQNALVVSDYYLIPTIMDDLSANGIQHLHSLIQNTIFGQISLNYKDIINQNKDVPYFKFFRKGSPQLLGIFESIKKSTTSTDEWRNIIRDMPEFKNKLFKQQIYNHIDTARATGQGQSVFSVNIAKEEYSPHFCYGNLVFQILDKSGIEYVKIKKTSDWL